MSVGLLESLPKSRLKALLDHFGQIEDPREPWRVAHPLPEVLLLVVCGTICDCEDYDLIAEWGEEHLAVLRRYLPYHYGVPGGRWLTQLMNRINPGLFAAAFTAWVRASWPDRPEFVAIDGKTSRRSHDRATGTPPLHLVSAFGTTARLVLGQEAVPDKASETTAIPALIERLAEDDGLKGALVSIDAVATTAAIAGTIRRAGADSLLAVKANQPTLRSEVEALFAAAEPAALDRATDLDKGHGRIEERTITVAREVDWLEGARRFPGELRPASCARRVAPGELRPASCARRVAPAGRGLCGAGRIPHRAEGLLPVRDPRLHLVRAAHRHARRARRARALAH
jgi:predicted transposase YbfD/YdcC